MKLKTIDWDPRRRPNFTQSLNQLQTPLFTAHDRCVFASKFRTLTCAHPEMSSSLISLQNLGQVEELQDSDQDFDFNHLSHAEFTLI
jgi:hypothetical protein